MQYAQAMGLGEKKPRNQLQGSRMTDEYRETLQQRMEGGSGQPGSEANEEKNFWDGFRKGLGLNEGEEVGGGLRDVGFAAQDTAAHKPGMILDEYLYMQDSEEEDEPSPEPGPEPGPHPDSSSTEGDYDEAQPLINPNVAVDEEELIDILDFESISEGILMGTTQGAGATFQAEASLQGDMAQIAPALESMIQILDEDGSNDIKGYIEGLYKDVLRGIVFDTYDWHNYELQELAFGNEIYRRGFDYNDGIRAEMEVLNSATVYLYNEQGETLDDIVMDFIGLFLPGDSESDSSGGDFINYWLEAIVDSIKEQYDPGEILMDGDIRISIQTLVQAGNGEYTHYFFRESEFLYSVNTMTGEVVYGEKYDKILAEMIQDTID